jgi:hypothetical protein
VTRSVSIGRAAWLSDAARPTTGTSTWSSVSASAHPFLRLGGASPGGLALPPANPTPGQMYAPRGVWTDGSRIIACDTGNHRILIWHTLPTHDGADADVVLGQADFTSEGPAAGAADTERGLYLPTGVTVIDGRLVVCDAWHHRVLAWDGIPAEDFERPSWVLGQADLASVEANRGGEPALDTLYWPFGCAVVDDVFWVADTGNRRVLGWRGDGIPDPIRPADILLGQDEATAREDNRGGSVTASSFRWPHAIAGDEQTLFIADAGDHRVLSWSPPPANADQPADGVLGQDDLASTDEFKIRPQGAQRMRFPYAVVSDADRLVVADTSNNRVLIWHGIPRGAEAFPADTVLGQPDMDANGENRWSAVTDDSLCWPYGLSLAGNLLAIADSGNNRVMLWRVE